MKTFAMVRYGQRHSHSINFTFSGKGEMSTIDLSEFPSHLNCELNGPLNTLHEAIWN